MAGTWGPGRGRTASWPRLRESPAAAADYLAAAAAAAAGAAPATWPARKKQLDHHSWPEPPNTAIRPPARNTLNPKP